MRRNAIVFFFGGHFLWSFFRAGLGKYGLKSFTPPNFACSYGSGMTPSISVIKETALKTQNPNPNFRIHLLEIG